MKLASRFKQLVEAFLAEAESSVDMLAGLARCLKHFLTLPYHKMCGYLKFIGLVFVIILSFLCIQD